MNIFREGQKIRVKRTLKPGIIITVIDEDFDEEIGCTKISYEVLLDDEKSIKYFTVYDLEEYKELLSQKEKIYLKTIVEDTDLEEIEIKDCAVFLYGEYDDYKIPCKDMFDNLEIERRYEIKKLLEL